MQSTSAKRRTMSTANSKSLLPKLNSSLFHKKHNPELIDKHSSVLLFKKQTQNTRKRLTTQINASQESRTRHLGDSSHRGPIEQRLKGEVDAVLGMFKKINRLREQYGVISLREQDQDDTFYLQSREITYNPELPQLNEQICCLKRDIQQKIDKVLTMAKYFPKMQRMIETVLDEHADSIVSENARVGKIAAMKAQRRLIEASHREQQRLNP